MSNMFFIMMQAGAKSIGSPKEKKKSTLGNYIKTLFVTLPLVYFIICLLGALPYVFLQ